MPLLIGNPRTTFAHIKCISYPDNSGFNSKGFSSASMGNYCVKYFRSNDYSFFCRKEIKHLPKEIISNNQTELLMLYTMNTHAQIVKQTCHKYHELCVVI